MLGTILTGIIAAEEEMRAPAALEIWRAEEVIAAAAEGLVAAAERSRATQKDSQRRGLGSGTKFERIGFGFRWCAASPQDLFIYT